MNQRYCSTGNSNYSNVPFLHLNSILSLCLPLLWQVAAFITAPFDVVKTHKQIEFGEKVLYASEPVKSLPQTDTVAALQRIFRTSGIKGLFAGVLPRVIKVAPACAIMITSFEYGKAVFFKHNVKNHLERHGTIQWREWWWLMKLLCGKKWIYLVEYIFRCFSVEYWR